MKARGVEIGTNKVVEGYHCKIEGLHFILLDEAELDWQDGYYLINGLAEIHPLSLALDTGRTDRKGKSIFGSYPVDGVMSKGGDRVRKPGVSGEWDEYDVKFSNGCFYLPDNWELADRWRSCEIIGSQWAFLGIAR